MSSNRIGALTGAVFVVCLIASFVIGGEPPSQDDSVQEIVDFYADQSDGAFFSGAVLAVLAITALVFFGGHMRKVFGAASGLGHVLPSVVLAGTIVMAVGAAFDTTLYLTMHEAVDDVDPLAMQTLNALWNNDFVPMAVGGIVFSLASGLAVLRYGVLPKWLGWVAIVLAVITFTPIGFAGTGLWILVVSIMLAVRDEEPAAA